MTEDEAKARRERMRKIDTYVYRQNMVSACGSVLIALVAFGGAIYLASIGQGWTATALVGTTLGVVVYAISRANK